MTNWSLMTLNLILNKKNYQREQKNQRRQKKKGWWMKMVVSDKRRELCGLIHFLFLLIGKLKRIYYVVWSSWLYIHGKGGEINTIIKNRNNITPLELSNLRNSIFSLPKTNRIWLQSFSWSLLITEDLNASCSLLFSKSSTPFSGPNHITECHAGPRLLKQ